MKSYKSSNTLDVAEMTKKPANLLSMLILYLILTFLLYLWGPIEWKTHNTVLTFLLIALYFAAIAIGGSSVKYKPQPIKKDGEARFDWSNQWFFKHYRTLAILCVGLRVFSLIRLMKRYNYSSIGDIISLIFSDYGDLYFAESSATSGAEMFGGALYSLISVLASPITFLFVPVSIIVFRHLKVFDKILASIGIFLWAIFQLTQGTNIGLFTLIITLGFSFMFRDKKAKQKSTDESKFKKIAIIIILAILFILAFNFSMSARMGSSDSFTQIGENSVNKSSWLYDNIPQQYKNLLIWFDFYICQGYYGFSLATEVPWQPMFGAGFSRWLCLELDAVLPFDVYESTYQYRIEEAGFDWGESANWHTAFTWFANDLGLIGVIFLMLILGRLFNLIYYDFINFKRPTDFGLLLLLIQLIVFIPCNNYIFSNSTLLVPFFVFLAYWMATRKKMYQEITE